MKFQSASKKEIIRVAAGSGICLAVMLAVCFVLSCFGAGVFDHTVLLGGVLCTNVAILNFAALCLTIQKAAQIEDKKQMKARIQLSYHARLLLQAAWVVAAFLIPWLHGIAGALPLLFPSVVIFFLQSRGKLVTPSDRKNQPAQNAEEDLPDIFDA